MMSKPSHLSVSSSTMAACAAAVDSPEFYPACIITGLQLLHKIKGMCTGASIHHMAWMMLSAVTVIRPQHEGC